MFKKAFGVLQKVGKALMLPVALLPAAGEKDDHYGKDYIQQQRQQLSL